MPFLTLLDDRAKIKGSRDPLGFQSIWTRLGRRVVKNLTTVTTSSEQLINGWKSLGVIYSRSRNVLKVNRLLRQVIKQSVLDIKADPNQHGLEVKFKNGRSQRIVVECQEVRYVLTSVVLSGKQIKKIGRGQILTRLWERNRQTNVVAFSLNNRGDLVGRVEQLTETIDAEELAFYIALLARECDQFEYVLTGQDRE